MPDQHHDLRRELTETERTLRENEIAIQRERWKERRRGRITAARRTQRMQREMS